MSSDTRIFGDGRYPDTGILAVGVRALFLLAIISIVVAVFLPSAMVPDFVKSYRLQHFAAFYVAMLLAMAAMPRTPIRQIALGYLVFSVGLESLHLLSGAGLRPLLQNWSADLGGVAAAFAPVIVARFRRRFPRDRA